MGFLNIEMDILFYKYFDKSDIVENNINTKKYKWINTVNTKVLAVFFINKIEFEKEIFLWN